MTMRYHITREEFEALPEGLRGEYAELTDGENKGMYRLQLADNPVAAFRANNIAQQRRIEELTASLTAANSSKAQVEAALAAYTDENGNKLDADEVKRIVKEVADRNPGKKPDVAQAIAAELKPLQTQLAAVQEQLANQTRIAEENKTAAKRAAKVALLRQVAEPVLATGAFDLVEHEAVELFDLSDDGKTLVPKKNDAEGNPVTPQRYFDGFRKQKPFLVKASGSPRIGDPREGDPPMRDGKHVLVNPTPLEHGQAMKKREDSKGAYDFIVERK